MKDKFFGAGRIANGLNMIGCATEGARFCAQIVFGCCRL
jgi:hypothetical protein